MRLFLVLSPDSTIHGLSIVGADVAGDPGLGTVVEDVAATVTVGGDTLLRTEPDTARSTHGHCHTGGFAGPFSCIHLDFRPVPGETYTVTVTAADRPMATATTHVPGDFELLEAEADGFPPGTDGLSVRWTESEGAYRYLVGIRILGAECLRLSTCPDGWSATTTETTLDTIVPADRLPSDEDARWFVDVHAMDRALYEYLTTGSGGEFFGVRPVSNVEGGYGVVGSWVRR